MYMYIYKQNGYISANVMLWYLWGAGGVRLTQANKLNLLNYVCDRYPVCIVVYGRISLLFRPQAASVMVASNKYNIKHYNVL